MGLQGNGTIPAVYSERIRLAKHAGMAVMEMYKKDIRPRDIMTKEAFMNVVGALSENVQNAKDWFQSKKTGKESIETKEDE